MFQTASLKRKPVNGILIVLNHDGSQRIGGFEGSQNAFDNTHHSGNECPAEQKIQNAHPNPTGTEFVYAERTEQQSHRYRALLQVCG